MSIQSFVPVNNLLAPVTSGTAVQYFTDVYGEVWIAKNGVQGGNWIRARDTLHAICTRNAAFNWSTSNTALPFDTATKDVWGMFASNGFTIPVPGWYRACMWVWDGGSSTVPLYSQMQITQNGTAVSSDNNFASSAVSHENRATALMYCQQADKIAAVGYCNIANVAWHTGYASNRLEISYQGSG